MAAKWTPASGIVGPERLALIELSHLGRLSDGSKMILKRAQHDPKKMAQDCARWSKDGSKMAPDVLKTACKMAQYSIKLPRNSPR